MARKRKTPQRLCLGCRTMKNKRELLRVVRTPQGEIELDVTGKKAGRGAYICPHADCLQKALRSKALEKSLRTTLAEDILQLLREKLAD
ncbi:MAG: YlxR family protein [Firmicutes bacterium]|nr:YlxR family protein [Bacillota bacterium]